MTGNGEIHVVVGRFNTFQYNTDMHHVYLPARDTWEEKAKLPTARSGHGMVVTRAASTSSGGKDGILERGQAQDAKVFGQMESYDPASDTWQSQAPMPTPRHAVAAVSMGTGSTWRAAVPCWAARCRAPSTRRGRWGERQGELL